MEVCEVCGSFLIVNDAQARVEEHISGKQHMGYAKLRSALEEIRVQIIYFFKIKSEVKLIHLFKRKKEQRSLRNVKKKELNVIRKKDAAQIGTEIDIDIEMVDDVTTIGIGIDIEIVTETESVIEIATVDVVVILNDTVVVRRAEALNETVILKSIRQVQRVARAVAVAIEIVKENQIISDIELEVEVDQRVKKIQNIIKQMVILTTMNIRQMEKSNWKLKKKSKMVKLNLTLKHLVSNYYFLNLK